MVLFEFRFKMQLFGECFNFCESVGILFEKGFFSRVAVDEMGFEHGLLFVDGNTYSFGKPRLALQSSLFSG